MAFVTGGGTGIGRGIALGLAAHGADVVLASRDRAHLDPVSEEIRELGRRVLVCPLDVRVRGDVEAAGGRTVAELGRLDILVNNAAGNFLARAEELSENAWRAVVDIVLNGTFNTSRAAFEPMCKAGGGAVVNITTTYVDTGAAFLAHSGAAKAGVLNLTRSLAAESGRYGIRANAVAPGLVEETEGARRLVETKGRLPQFMARAPLRRLTRIQDVVHAVLFLASRAAEHVSGAQLVVDGAESVGGKYGTNPESPG